MLDLLALIRPAQILQAVVGRVVVDVVDGVLVVPLGEAEGDRHEHVNAAGFAVDFDINVAAFFGFGGGDHAFGGFEASEGGDLRFGGSFGSFGDFDHLVALRSPLLLLLLLLLLLCFFFWDRRQPLGGSPWVRVSPSPSPWSAFPGRCQGVVVVSLIQQPPRPTRFCVLVPRLNHIVTMRRDDVDRHIVDIRGHLEGDVVAPLTVPHHTLDVLVVVI